MRTLPGPLESVDVGITHWMARHGVVILRVALGVVFLWFGLLKFFPGLSPAQTLAVDTIDVLTLGLLPGSVSLVLLATLECAIGLGLISGRLMRLTLLLLAFQMVGAASPLFLFPGEVFTAFPYAPTLEGQYIIKNIVLVSAGLIIGATVRGGGLTAHPEGIEGARQTESQEKEQTKNNPASSAPARRGRVSNPPPKKRP
ncbi:DoxX family membrane protein [Rubrobacter tropicus]|uniref:DoxX family membrane protein n=1 Tax=Rubrobacter tropicus TaxID=2653851 RepID=A0A6G8QCG2_9ACTN|nr:DoxX family protein [Rubrobacter tropicus]QIN83957.1 DoxX family membrane protein [Rubrobacter tropicus]